MSFILILYIYKSISHIIFLVSLYTDQYSHAIYSFVVIHNSNVQINVCLQMITLMACN